MANDNRCPDCGRPSELDRRDFLKTTAAGIALPVLAGSTGRLFGAEETAKKNHSETLSAQLFKSLNPDQRKMCTFKFDDPLRQKVDNNWFITESRVGKHFNKDQQKLIEEIFLGLHSPEYAQTVMQQVEHDGGFLDCSIALFGEPDSGKFEFVLSGRHVTRRCDGDAVEGAAFGGPIFYGHAAEDFNETAEHPGNVYWYQAKRANELFKALNGKQRERALLDSARPETGTDTVKLAGKNELAGLPFSELTPDVKELGRKVMTDLLAPFREADRIESMKLVEAAGFDNLHISYSKNLDIGNDGVWDVWMIEGPSMVWYFRGHPHVHTWVNIRAPKTA
jgi:hypothetical protein